MNTRLSRVFSHLQCGNISPNRSINVHLQTISGDQKSLCIFDVCREQLKQKSNDKVLISAHEKVTCNHTEMPETFSDWRKRFFSDKRNNGGKVASRSFTQN